MLSRFLDLLERSVIVQGIVTTLVIGTMCYLFVIGRPIPEVLVTFASLILGYWFGTKSQNALNRVRDK